MITLEKFVKALTQIKVDGHWSLGLVIARPGAVDFTVFPVAEKILADGATDMAEIIKKIVKAFEADKWVILEIKNNLSTEIYSQLKSLSTRNCLVRADGLETLQPSTSRVAVVASSDTVRIVEKIYPDFKFLFGPVITL